MGDAELLRQFDTAQLVEELKHRGGVDSFSIPIESHLDCYFDGPAVVLKITDRG